jgi:hypothetical protein
LEAGDEYPGERHAVTIGTRFLIGIDLGTTNSVVAYVDAQEVEKSGTPHVHVFPVMQLVAEGEASARSILPSFLYFPTESDLARGGYSLPWDESPAAIVGVFARDRGALVPGHQVASAKSWLAHPAVDRRGTILPLGAEPPEPMVSPVDALEGYLLQMRYAWNHSMAAGNQDLQFERQEIVLTVPASFDEEARELTVEAAQQAGLERLSLLEEPLAAFYAWIAANRERLKAEVHDGDLVLICDVGGGTTDFSLIRVRIVDSEVQFERTAIGDHLLLGGDNLDLALARQVEEKLGSPNLSLRQRNALRRTCSAAKERLLTEPELETLPITVLGTGRGVVGGALTTGLSRDAVLRTLTDGFLPRISADDLPSREKRTGLRELGLPYAGEPAITRHLAAFLRRAASSLGSSEAKALRPEHPNEMARPDVVLFNGGFFTPAVAREKIVDVLASWFGIFEPGWRPRIFSNQARESAVALGAAYYNHLRRTGGLRIRAGSARVYYIGVAKDATDQRIQGVCVLPPGVEEGSTLPLANRDFMVLTNRPVSFTLYSSASRHDAHGDLVTLDSDQVHRHAPLAAVLRFGKHSRNIELAVHLTAKFTELGTLELWCESLSTQHRWRLQFELRDTGPQDARAAPPDETSSAVPESSLASAEQVMRLVFGDLEQGVGLESIAPEAVMGRLETVLQHRKDAWPLSVIRKLADVLLELAEGRRKSRSFEARWLNLFGFCLRPGFGALLDDWRIAQARKIYMAGLSFAKDPQCQVEWVVLWRRVAGGLNAGQQQEIHQKYKALLGIGQKKRSGRLNRQFEQEVWRLLANLERLPVSARIALGNDLLTRIKADPLDKSLLWSIGRLGARIPLYGPLNALVPAGVASEWLLAVLDLPVFTPEAASAVSTIGARTDDPARDISDDLRQSAIRKLQDSRASEELIRSLREYVPPASTDAFRMFGESLPQGLRLAG